jgi:hypothetical protein
MVIRIRKQYILDSSFFRYVVSQESMTENALFEYELACPFIYLDGVVVTRKATMGVRGYDGDNDYVRANNEIASGLTQQTFVLGHDVIFFQAPDDDDEQEDDGQEVIQAIKAFCEREKILVLTRKATN